MTVQMSGTRDGADWPARGELLNVSDDEGAQLIAAGLADVAESDAPATDLPLTTEATPRRRK